MPKTEFESVEDLEVAIRAVMKFADDALLGRLFELTHESNLFHDREVHDRLCDHIHGVRAACLTIGIFLGARVADPSGKILSDLRAAWIRSRLAQPRYEHLAGGDQ